MGQPSGLQNEAQRNKLIPELLAQLGRNAGKDKIRNYLIERGYTATDYIVRSMKEEMVRHSEQEFHELVQYLAETLPTNPGVLDVKRKMQELGRNPTTYYVGKLYEALKRVPSLWHKGESLRTTFCGVDAELLAALEEMTGKSTLECASMLVRAFALATTRYRLDLVELVKASNQVPHQELLLSLQLFRSLNLRGVR